MAAVAENGFGSDDQFIHHQSVTVSPSSDSKSEFQRDVQQLVDLLSKLNPSAKEFFPSSYSPDHQSPRDDLSGVYKDLGSDGYSNNRRKRNNYNQGRRRLNGRTFRSQREDSIRRTVYVSDIDQHVSEVTEERLAALFTNCGQVSFGAPLNISFYIG
ncbi:hypothetical protein HHK36_004938 [Tetracentron sinense]|uniref:Ataxin-2 C-terminal domain-containing protein n=1 Tax=Tetracentron sinense TaxID=13715 RepID=A0A834ZK04_TETSI|nr:hypothetical protein HHK36_004938 [Tetracentron sinense]